MVHGAHTAPAAMFLSVNNPNVPNAQQSRYSVETAANVTYGVSSGMEQLQDSARASQRDTEELTQRSRNSSMVVSLIEIQSAVAAEHFLSAIHCGHPEVMTKEFLAIVDGGMNAVLQDAGQGFWEFGGYRFRKPTRLGIEYGGLSTVIIGALIAATAIPILGFAFGGLAFGGLMVTAWKQNSSGKRSQEEIFEERYKFPLFRLLKGKAWASDFWDLEAGDSWLDMVLKCKWSPLWTSDQKDRLIQRLLLRILSLSDEAPSLKVMRLAKAVARSRHAMTKFRWGLSAEALDHRWLAASEVLGEVVGVKGTEFESLFESRDLLPPGTDETPTDLLITKRVQTACNRCAALTPNRDACNRHPGRHHTLPAVLGDALV